MLGLLKYTWEDVSTLSAFTYVRVNVFLMEPYPSWSEMALAKTPGSKRVKKDMNKAILSHVLHSQNSESN